MCLKTVTDHVRSPSNPFKIHVQLSHTGSLCIKSTFNWFAYRGDREKTPCHPCKININKSKKNKKTALYPYTWPKYGQMESCDALPFSASHWCIKTTSCQTFPPMDFSSVVAHTDTHTHLLNWPRTPLVTPLTSTSTPSTSPPSPPSPPRPVLSSGPDKMLSAAL